MIDEVDEALRRLLCSDAIGDADITFDPAGGERAERGRRPVIEVRLDEVTEDVAMRHAFWEDVHEDGRVRWRRPPMRWYRLAYEITARANGAEAEHRLLSSVLRCLVVHEQLPGHCLVGSLGALEATVLLTVAAPRPTDRPLWEARLRPSLSVVVTAPVQPAGVEEAAGAPQTSRLSVGRAGATADTVSSAPGDAAMRRPAAPPPAPSTAPVRRGRRVTTSA
jgi:hypothetical protein